MKAAVPWQGHLHLGANCSLVDTKVYWVLIGQIQWFGLVKYCCTSTITILYTWSLIWTDFLCPFLVSTSITKESWHWRGKYFINCLYWVARAQEAKLFSKWSHYLVLGANNFLTINNCFLQARLIQCSFSRNLNKENVGSFKVLLDIQLTRSGCFIAGEWSSLYARTAPLQQL